MFKKTVQNKKIRISLKDPKGFTLLFAILVSILVLAVGSSMITIALKQVILSGTGRESQYAFYAANTGAECAIYWDLNGPELVNGQIEYVFPPPGEAQLADLGDVDCGGGNIVTGTGFSTPYTDEEYSGDSLWDFDESPTVNTVRFRMVMNNSITGVDDLLYCVEVTVEKAEDIFDGTVNTTVTSQGLNSCDPDGDTRAVQRGLVLKYQS